MASVQDRKTSLFLEAAPGARNTVSGQAYPVGGNGSWRPRTQDKEANEQWRDAQAPLSDSVSSVTVGHEGKYSHVMRTHGDEIWWAYTLGGHIGSPAEMNPPTVPRTWVKQYRSSPRGPEGTLTVVQDEPVVSSAGFTNYQSVYTGTRVRSWSVDMLEGQPVISKVDLVSPLKTSTGGSPLSDADYVDSGFYHFADLTVRLGDVGDSGFVADELTLLRFQQDNRLNTKRIFIDGIQNMADPQQGEPNRGTLTMEFNHSAFVETYLIDRRLAGTRIWVEAELSQPPLSATFRWSNLFIRNAYGDAKVGDLGIVTASCDMRMSTDDALVLSYVTTGNTNP